MIISAHTHTQTHNCFTALFWDNPGELVGEQIFFWTLWYMGR